MGCSASKASPTPSLVASSVEIIEPEVAGPDLRPGAEFVWFWEEDQGKVAEHHTWRKKGNFIAYPPRVSAHIEREYVATMLEGGAQFGKSAPLEITYKVSNDHTGYQYSIDFLPMKQINSGTGWRRSILREKNEHYKPPEPSYAYAETVVPARVVGVEPAVVPGEVIAVTPPEDGE